MFSSFKAQSLKTGRRKYRSALVGNDAFGTAFEHIQTITVGAGGAASITFSSIPQTYKHLQIRGTARTQGTATNFDVIGCRFNGDTGSNYATHYLYGNGSSAISFGAASQTYMNVWAAASNGMSANIFGTFIFDVLDYSSTAKYKTLRVLGGVDTNGNGGMFLTSGLWMSTGAITSISFPTAISQYTSFSLYGVKG